MSQHKHIHPAPVSAGRQIATALALAGLAAFSLPAVAADHYVSTNDGNVQRGNYNNDGATGGNSIAVGVNAGASGQGASAIGAGASATGRSSIGLGTSAEATGNVSTAIGEQAKATENGATALGTKSNASGGGSTAIGSGSQASAQNATALGGGSNAAGNASIAVGVQSSASAGQSVAIGRHAVADTNDSVALGSYSKTATAVGTSSATVNGITYGGFAGAAPVGTVSVGDAGAERTITNVAAGRITPTSTDAINGSQLYQVASQIDNNFTKSSISTALMIWTKTCVPVLQAPPPLPSCSAPTKRARAWFPPQWAATAVSRHWLWAMPPIPTTTNGPPKSAWASTPRKTSTGAAA
jgi:hypothetical protein